MTINRLAILSLGSIAIFLVGCNNSGGGETYKPKAQEKITPIQIVAGQEGDFFPAKAGNQWDFEGETLAQLPQGPKTSKTVVTFKIVEVADTPEGQVATIDVSSDNRVSDRLKWRIGANGIYQISGSIRDKATSELKEVKFEPPVPIIPFPVKDGGQIEVSSTGIRPGAGVGAFKSKVTTDGIQEVDTAMGRFSSLGATAVLSYKEKDISFQTVTTAYWAPKIGMVRYVQEIVAVNSQGKSISSNSVLRLKSHTP